MAVFEEQKRRIDRIVGKVDVIVTDSPLLLQVAYIKEDAAVFEKMAVAAHKNYNSFNLFINRGKIFEQAGRIHDLKESQKVDMEIKDILTQAGVYYGNYYHITMPVVVQNIQVTLQKLQLSTQAADKSLSLKDKEPIALQIQRAKEAAAKNSVASQKKERATEKEEQNALNH